MGWSKCISIHTASANVTFAPGSSEACATVVLVDSVDLEMPESFLVRLQLTNPALNERIMSDDAGIVEIIDDDGAWVLTLLEETLVSVLSYIYVCVCALRGCCGSGTYKLPAEQCG